MEIRINPLLWLNGVRFPQSQIDEAATLGFDATNPDPQHVLKKDGKALLAWTVRYFGTDRPAFVTLEEDPVGNDEPVES